MRTTPWFRRPTAELEREQARVLREWVLHEVRPFSPFWADRLRGVGAAVDGRGSITVVPIAAEADLAGAGGPGNPALLLSPTEAQFKRHALRGELVAAAREAGRGGVDGRRNAVWTRYKPVHVHEAGVDRLLAIAYTRTDLDRLHLAGARLAEVMGWGAEDALLNLVPAGPSVRFWGLYHAALATRMTALHPRGAGQALMGPARRGLTLLPASILSVPTDEAVPLLEGLLDAGSPAPNLRLVVPVGPPPDAAARTRLAELGERLAGRPVRVQAAWAPETSRLLYGESPTAANDPPEATYGLLTYPDLELLEVREPGRHELVPDGEPVELVVTSIGWRGTALVRAATGSWVGGLIRGSAHPISGATVPRLAPAAVDAAWQPALGGGRRVDLRGVTHVVEPAVTRMGVASWSLRVVDGALILALDRVPPDERAVGELLDRLAGTVGHRPQVRYDAALADRRPQVGLAG
jgi:hypothetical protein